MTSICQIIGIYFTIKNSALIFRYLYFEIRIMGNCICWYYIRLCIHNLERPSVALKQLQLTPLQLIKVGFSELYRLFFGGRLQKAKGF